LIDAPAGDVVYHDVDPPEIFHCRLDISHLGMCRWSAACVAILPGRKDLVPVVVERERKAKGGVSSVKRVRPFNFARSGLEARNCGCVQNKRESGIVVSILVYSLAGLGRASPEAARCSRACSTRLQSCYRFLVFGREYRPVSEPVESSHNRFRVAPFTEEVIGDDRIVAGVELLQDRTAVLSRVLLAVCGANGEDARAQPVGLAVRT
jgi:hypothetical protein